jgi:SOS response associated peptidase (SRAP)
LRRLLGLLTDDEVALATWKKPDGSLLESFTIITTEPNKLMRTIHRRMPVILHRDLNQVKGGLNLPGTRIFNPVTVAGLCVTIGRYRYLFKRLTAVPAGRFYRFEHIRADSSGKVVAK